MKTLFVLRHAKARRDAPAGTDFDRSLNKRGHKAAFAIGQRIAAAGLIFDAIVASPAVRVVETVSGLLEGSGRTLGPVYDQRLYNAPPETLLNVIREVDDAVERLLIVGHNPGLQHLLLHLAEEDRDGLRGDVAFNYPTATLAELCLPVGRWREIGSGTGRIVSLVRPRDLDPALSGPV